MKTRQRFWRWLVLQLIRGDPDRVYFTLSRPMENLVNAQPFIRRWYGCRYGLWRKDGKPVPVRATRFRRT